MLLHIHLQSYIPIIKINKIDIWGGKQKSCKKILQEVVDLQICYIYFILGRIFWGYPEEYSFCFFLNVF